MSNTLHSNIVSAAYFSSDRKYRYSLTRTIVTENHKKLLFILLNPSKADALQNDDTVMHCQNIAFSIGRNSNFLQSGPSGPFSAFRICNLFAFVEVNTNKMSGLSSELTDRLHQSRNDLAIKCACDWADHIVCAWGTTLSNKSRRNCVLNVLKASGKPLWCFGKATDGNPFHPSRGARKNLLIPFP